MSAYPPGVTGNEPEIAGNPEVTMVMDCDSLTDLYAKQPLVDLQARAEEALAGRRSKDVEKVLREFVEAVRNGDTQADCCAFSGEVEGALVDRDTFVWTCPWCGTDHESDISE